MLSISSDIVGKQYTGWYLEATVESFLYIICLW